MISQTQHLSIGVLNTLSRNFIEEFINPLMSNDEVRFSLTAGRMDGLLNGLAEHELDLVLTNKPIGLEHYDQLWQSQLVSRQPLAIVGPADKKYVANFQQVTRMHSGCYPLKLLLLETHLMLCVLVGSISQK